jgi:hypothetical protein
MRPTQLASLVFLGLLVSGTLAHAERPEKRARPAKQFIESKNHKSNPTWQVSGFGETDQDAEIDALNNARAQVIKYLNAQGVALNWEPSLKFIKSLVKHSEPAQDKEFKVVGLVKEISLTVELTPQAYREILRKESDLKGQERMVFLAKILACVVAFLAAVAGYFRLEDATKGYYTAWLRFGVLGFAAAVGIGLWLIS